MTSSQVESEKLTIAAAALRGCEDMPIGQQVPVLKALAAMFPGTPEADRALNIVHCYEEGERNQLMLFRQIETLQAQAENAGC